MCEAIKVLETSTQEKVEKLLDEGFVVTTIDEDVPNFAIRLGPPKRGISRFQQYNYDSQRWEYCEAPLIAFAICAAQNGFVQFSADVFCSLTFHGVI